MSAEPARLSTIEVPAIPPETAPRAPRTWYFWGTTLFGVAVYGVRLLAATATLLLLLVWYHVPRTTSLVEIQALMRQGGWLAAVTIATCPSTLAALWLPIRIARRGFADYLALSRWPSWREIIRAVALTAAVLLIWMAIGLVLGEKTSPFVLESYVTARDAGLLPYYLIAICVAAPVSEEFLVRGFLFRGWSQSFLRPLGAIVLTSVVWTALHVQYDWYYLLQVFLLGLVLGYLRHRSGSTWLTVIIHAAVNIVSVVGTVLTIGD